MNLGSDFKLALTELLGKRHNWKSVAQALGVPAHNITIAETNHRDDNERCLEEILRYWFMNHPGSTQRELANALDTLVEATGLTGSESGAGENTDMGMCFHNII